MQGRATEARNQPELAEATLRRSLADMDRKVKETRRQVNGLDAALSELDMQRNLLVEQITAASQACGQARQQEGILRTSIEASLTEKHKVGFQCACTAAEDTWLQLLLDLVLGFSPRRAHFICSHSCWQGLASWPYLWQTQFGKRRCNHGPKVYIQQPDAREDGCLLANQQNPSHQAAEGLNGVAPSNACLQRCSLHDCILFVRWLSKRLSGSAGLAADDSMAEGNQATGRSCSWQV